jgi:hypothetical protein
MRTISIRNKRQKGDADGGARFRRCITRYGTLQLLDWCIPELNAYQQTLRINGAHAAKKRLVVLSHRKEPDKTILLGGNYLRLSIC